MAFGELRRDGSSFRWSMHRRLLVFPTVGPPLRRGRLASRRSGQLDSFDGSPGLQWTALLPPDNIAYPRPLSGT